MQSHEPTIVGTEAASPTSATMATPEPWRPSATTLTPHDMEEIQEALIEAYEQVKVDADVSVDVDLGDLGRLRIDADKDAGGIRLSLVAESHSSASVLESQSTALLQAMHEGASRSLG